ncbi:hypothetical protein AJ79_03653 [Helicocarpus griseus UAMH5409]|uniref:Uncharacterized protein n=1 Tax=Helicocarpus griseus UAMH5409 TaxID=1447875 RepID=A0A2B7XNN7_9EURO|nr:hypothetical protein AJ79_03653 [Helicocarpus griseus UAMH5409]
MPISDREGMEYMDGYFSFPAKDLVPFPGYLTVEELSLKNLPPKDRKLCDEQVEAIKTFADQKKIQKALRGFFGGLDFDFDGNIRQDRTKLPLKDIQGTNPRVDPPSFMSCGYPMWQHDRANEALWSFNNMSDTPTWSKAPKTPLFNGKDDAKGDKKQLLTRIRRLKAEINMWKNRCEEIEEILEEPEGGAPEPLATEFKNLCKKEVFNNFLGIYCSMQSQAKKMRKYLEQTAGKSSAKIKS